MRTYNKDWWRQYRLKNKEKKAESDRAWREKNREHDLARKIKYREENRERIAQYDKLYRQSHKQKRSEWTSTYHKERRNAEGSHTEEEWQELKAKYNFMCLSCQKFEPEVKLSRDHVVPFRQSGTNYISNIQPLCVNCNSRKKNKIIDYRSKYERS